MHSNLVSIFNHLLFKATDYIYNIYMIYIDIFYILARLGILAALPRQLAKGFYRHFPLTGCGYNIGTKIGFIIPIFTRNYSRCFDGIMVKQ